MDRSAKVKEAENCVFQAEKCMNTGKSFISKLLKGGPDKDSAIDFYKKAGVAYRLAKELEKSRDVYIKAAEIEHETNYFYQAGKSYEQAGLIANEAKRPEEAAQLIEKGGNLLIANGTPDSAVLTFEKAAKIVDKYQPDHSIHLYRKCVDISEAEDNARQAAEFIGKVGRIQLRHKRLEDARQSIRKEIDFYSQVENWAYINKLIIALVLIELHLGDYVEATKVFQSAEGRGTFSGGEEHATLSELLGAFDQGDGDASAILLNSPVIKYLDTDIAKLARDLHKEAHNFSGGGGGGSKTNNTGGIGDHGDEEASDLL